MPVPIFIPDPNIQINYLGSIVEVKKNVCTEEFCHLRYYFYLSFPYDELWVFCLAHFLWGFQGFFTWT